MLCQLSQGSQEKSMSVLIKLSSFIRRPNYRQYEYKRKVQSNTFMNSQRPRAFQQNSRQRFDTVKIKNFSPLVRNFQPRRSNEQFERTSPQRLSPIHKHTFNATTASTFEPRLDASGLDVPIQENY